MSKKGGTNHLNRLAAGKYPQVSRKFSKYIAVQNPGRHTAAMSLPIGVLLRDKLGTARTMFEVRKILKDGLVLVNGRKVRDAHYPVGFGDVVSIGEDKTRYVIGISRNGTVSIGEGSRQVFKVVGKYLARGKTQMIRLHDGTNMRFPEEVNVNDSVDLSDGKAKVIKLKEGAGCIVINGVHSSGEGTVKEIRKGNAQRDALVQINTKDGKVIETLLDNIMVI